jgi:hypothetical protein
MIIIKQACNCEVHFLEGKHLEKSSCCGFDSHPTELGLPLQLQAFSWFITIVILLPLLLLLLLTTTTTTTTTSTTTFTSTTTINTTSTTTQLETGGHSTVSWDAAAR